MLKKVFSFLLALSIICTAVFITPTITVRAAGSTYYVDANNGDDITGDGSTSNPWKTINKAASVVQAGDTVNIRSGIYRETVRPANSGTEGAYITFEADEGAEVVISGADPITSEWSLYSDNIYKTQTTLGIGKWEDQIFVDGVAMNLARWPNAGTDPLEPVFLEADEGTDNSKIIDSELTQPDGYWNGAAVIVEDMYRWTIGSTIVKSYTKGQLNLDSFSTFGLGVNGEYGSPYYLIGKLVALDSPNEWYYDYDSKTLYLYTPDGNDPVEHIVEVKKRDLAFNLDNRDYIRIKGINLFANTLDTNKSNFIEIDGINAKYISHYELSHINGVHQYNSSGIQLGGTNNILENSILAYSPGNLVTMNGENNKVINNLMHEVAYGPNYTTNQAHIYATGKNHLISHNTLYNSGRSAITGSVNNCRIQYNHAYDVMKLTDDGGFMYFSNVDGNGTEIHHNIFHGAYTNPPHHIVGGIYLDFATFDFKVFNNVVSDVNTFGVFFHSYNLFTQAYNNTFYNSSRFRMKDDGGALDAYGTRIINNITYDRIQIAPGFGIVERNNLTPDDYTSVEPLFIDPQSGDFRLHPESQAIDAGGIIEGITDGYIGEAPDIGAYEFGGEVWEAGHDFENPPNPTFTTTEIPYQTLLANGFFERETDTVGGWIKTHAKTAVIERSGNDASSSRHAWTRGLKLGSSVDGVEQTVSGLKPNTEYELRGFGKAGTSGQAIRIGIRDYGGDEIYKEITATSWEKEKIRFTTGESNTSATVYIFKPTTGGFAFADDVTLVEVDPDAPEEFEYGDGDEETEPGVTIVNDRDIGTGLNQYEFVGNWMQGPNINAYKGDCTFSNIAGDYYQIRFVGKRIELYSEMQSVAGIVAVSIDGGEEILIDLYSPEQKTNVLVYTSPELSEEEHILKVRITGDKNEKATGTWHTADRVIIFSDEAEPPIEPEPIEYELIYEEDFENVEVGSMPEGWNYSTDDQVSVTGDSEGNRRLTIEESGNGETTLARVEFSPIKEKARISLRVMAEQTGRSCNFLTLKDSNNEKLLELLFDQDYDNSGRRNIARRTPDNNWSSLQQYEANQWYEIEVDVDLTAGTYSVSIDGIPVAENIMLLKKSEDITYYEFAPHRWDPGVHHVDDIKIYGVATEEEPKLEYKAVLEEDFENIEVGSMPEGWSYSTDDQVSVTEDSEGNHRLTVKESGNGIGTSASVEFEPIQDKARVELRVMAEQTGQRIDFLRLRGSNGEQLLGIIFDQDYDNSGRRSIALVTPDGNWTGLQRYEANQWYDIEIDIDINTGTFDVSIDGVLVKEDFPFLNASNDISEYQIYTYRWAKGNYHIDDIKIEGFVPKSEQQTIIKIEDIGAITVEYGTSLEDIGLPEEVEVTLDDGNKIEVGVNWDNGDPGYDGNTAGEYTFTGELTELPGGVVNSNNLKVMATVVVEELIEVSEISIISEDWILYITSLGETLQMIAEVKPDNATNKSVAWSVVDENNEETDAATIDEKGLITAIKDGVIKVIATANDGSEVKGETIVTIDSTPPVIKTPEKLTFQQTEPVFVDITATDNVSGLQKLEINLNGEIVDKQIGFDPLELRLGSYLITVTATDHAGHQSEAEFVLEITTEVDYLDELIEFGYDHGLINNKGIKNSLLAHVDNIQRDKDNTKKFENSIKAMRNVVNAQSGKHIDEWFAEIIHNSLTYITK